ncbi:MAG: histidine kinase N-terminal 7TM domain-containing protein, partial [Spirochaetota bacterium]
MILTLGGVVMSVAGLGAGLCAIYTWPRRAMPGGTDLALMMVSVSIWCLTASFEDMETVFATKLLWSKLCYVGITTLSPLWFLFALRYSRRDLWLRPWHLIALWVIPAVTLVAAMTNDLHGLIWPTVTPIAGSPNGRLVYGHGPIVWLDAVYSYVFMTAGLAFFGYGILRSPALLKRQYWALVGALVAPFIGSVVYMSGIGPLGWDLTPLAFTVSVALIALGLVRYQILNIVPMAHDTLVSKMPDGVLVVDARGRIVNSNPAALL